MHTHTLLSCLQLSELHVEKWQVLSHHSATYTSIRDPTQTFKPPGRSNIKTGVAHPATSIPDPWLGHVTWPMCGCSSCSVPMCNRTTTNCCVTKCTRAAVHEAVNSASGLSAGTPCTGSPQMCTGRWGLAQGYMGGWGTSTAPAPGVITSAVTVPTVTALLLFAAQTADTSTDFHIPADHRVRRVCAAAGELHWAAGGRCLNLLEIETVPGTMERRGWAPP